MANLINAEGISKSYGTKILLNNVSLGLSQGDVIGVVGRNGDGKSTLLKILTGSLEADSGKVVRAKTATIGYLQQKDSFAPNTTVRQAIIGNQEDYIWASNPVSREIVNSLLSDLSLDQSLDNCSGGERRRVALVQLMLAGHDLLILDEPTNHLDIEAINWLAVQLNKLQENGTAMLVVSHDRWFLDQICNHIWEVHDGIVSAYEGGYAAYVLAKAERTRQLAASEARRKNLLRKELAWLRRGPPARTSKPKFRIAAANNLIANEPPARDKLALQQFATTRLGKDVFDLHQAGLRLGNRVLLKDLNWSIGPGDRIGIVGVNGAGKTTLLEILAGFRALDSGKLKQGQTLRLAYLSQTVAELDDQDTVLANVNRLKLRTKLATGRETSANTLLEDFGFRGETLVTKIGELSGGERRRLQLLRLLLEEPNVLLLDEPTNDLDIDTLTVIEDYLDTWPGTLIIVSHDRYFLERTCDVIYALLGDGNCVLLPGGLDQYLELRVQGKAELRGTTTTLSPSQISFAGDIPLETQQDPNLEISKEAKATPAKLRQWRKDLARLEGQISKTEAKISELQAKMAQAATDYQKLADLDGQLQLMQNQLDEYEENWLEISALLE